MALMRMQVLVKIAKWSLKVEESEKFMTKKKMKLERPAYPMTQASQHAKN